MDVLETLDIESWSGAFPAPVCARALDALESGRVAFLPRLAFAVEEQERQFLDPSCSDGKAKNISFNPRTGAVGGTSLSGDARGGLEHMLRRFATRSGELIKALLDDYAPHLQWGRTSFRPLEVLDRPPSSRRKDDRLLHADAFPSSPTQGRRILRVFSNVNPNGVARVWHVGEPFTDYAARFLPAIGRPWPGSAWLLERLGITRGRRTPYDHIMLQLHDRGKMSNDYQRNSPHAEIAFPAGSTWIVYTDATPHAALSGQYLLEQTFYLDVAAMRHPERSPLRTLERLTGRQLVRSEPATK